MLLHKRFWEASEHAIRVKGASRAPQQCPALVIAACLGRVVALANHAVRIQGVNRHPQQTLLQRDAELGAPDVLRTGVPDLPFFEHT